jgi:hypothetical protein
VASNKPEAQSKDVFIAATLDRDGGLAIAQKGGFRASTDRHAKTESFIFPQSDPTLGTPAGSQSFAADAGADEAIRDHCEQAVKSGENPLSAPFPMSQGHGAHDDRSILKMLLRRSMKRLLFTRTAPDRREPEPGQD